jgi:phenazine biosynthesis protein phzE
MTRPAIPAPATPAPGSGVAAGDLLARILGAEPPPFAVLHRPHATGPATAELLTGDVVTVDRLAGLPVEAGPLLAVVPFRQIRERGFDCVDDGAPLLALRVSRRATVPLADLVAALPDGPAGFTETGYDVPDAEYEASVRAVLADEIARGEGSNFVIHRALTGRVDVPPAQAALRTLRRLLLGEAGAYWTFAVHTPQRTFVGATPERHVSVDAGVARMNPISGTLRYPAGGYPDAAARRDAVLAFLDDPKERDELAMVVDEELKMMAVVGDRGGRVLGPYLKEMAHLAHTEYVLAGKTSLDVRDVLAATMFAPTVTGSPIRNACRVIARHERRGRGYYGGVLALLDTDEAGRQRLDAPILIRTADIDPAGAVRVPAGATLVRGSRPASELAETRAKAAGILLALQGTTPATAATAAAPGAAGGDGPVAGDPEVRARLAARNRTLAGFWLRDQPVPPAPVADVTVVEAEDDFTAMLAHALRSLGLGVRLVPWDALAPDPAAGRAAAAAAPGTSPGLVVLGPGPGDPADAADPRIATLRAVARARLAAGAPTLAVCLGHQVLAGELGLPLRRLPRPHQGVQREIDLFGTRTRVGFYNSYVALDLGDVPGLEIAADPADGRVDALRGKGFTGFQFHAESVLTSDGVGILRREVARLIPGLPAS